MNILPEIKSTLSQLIHSREEVEPLTRENWHGLYHECQEAHLPEYLITVFELFQRGGSRIKLYDGIYGLCYIGNSIPEEGFNGEKIKDPYTRQIVKKVHMASLDCFEIHSKSGKTKPLKIPNKINFLFSFVPGEELTGYQELLVDLLNMNLDSESGYLMERARTLRKFAALPHKSHSFLEIPTSSNKHGQDQLDCQSSKCVKLWNECGKYLQCRNMAKSASLI